MHWLGCLILPRPWTLVTFFRGVLNDLRTEKYICHTLTWQYRLTTIREVRSKVYPHQRKYSNRYCFEVRNAKKFMDYNMHKSIVDIVETYEGDGFHSDLYWCRQCTLKLKTEAIELRFNIYHIQLLSTVNVSLFLLKIMKQINTYAYNLTYYLLFIFFCVPVSPCNTIHVKLNKLWSKLCI